MRCNIAVEMNSSHQPLFCNLSILSQKLSNILPQNPGWYFTTSYQMPIIILFSFKKEEFLKILKIYRIGAGGSLMQIISNRYELKIS